MLEALIILKTRRLSKSQGVHQIFNFTKIINENAIESLLTVYLGGTRDFFFLVREPKKVGNRC